MMRLLQLFRQHSLAPKRFLTGILNGGYSAAISSFTGAVLQPLQLKTALSQVLSYFPSTFFDELPVAHA